MVIKVGIIGLSKGNGHPYSWGAICNGYEPEKMKDCGFPVIPEYLAKESWPKAKLSNVQVTHVWTQDRDLSNKVADAICKPEVVDNFTDMIGNVDAVLLARDDSETHFKFACPFLEKGIPIYIDKPITLSEQELKEMYHLAHSEYHIYTCSALRFAKELTITDNRQIGEITQIIGHVPKSWEKYAVHIIEPMLNLVSDDVRERLSERLRLVRNDSNVIIATEDDGEPYFEFCCYGNEPTEIKIDVKGTQGSCELVFEDTFSAFRKALELFFEGIQAKESRSPYRFNRQVVKILEKGMTLKCPRQS